MTAMFVVISMSAFIALYGVIRIIGEAKRSRNK